MSFPIPLRILFAAHPELLTPALGIVHRVITGFLLKQAGLKRSAADTGSVTLIQRFGSAANLNIHLHCLVLDGVYRSSGDEVVFHDARAPTGGELERLLDKIVARLMRMLTGQGYLIEEQEMTYLAAIGTDNPLASLQAASCTYRIALGPRAGQKVLSLRTDAHQRKELERLCRNITRPAIANERLSRNAKGQVVLRLKSPYRDGMTHIVMSAQEFTQRLAALVPRPKLHLIRFHGVLAPHAKLRAAVVPGTAEKPSQRACEHMREAARMSWARLLKRVFDIDIERCECGGQLKIIATIEEPAVISRILTHLGLPARAPPRSAARAPQLMHAA